MGACLICIKDASLNEAARFLLENGAYVNVTEGIGQTPIMLATSYEKK